MTAGRTRVVFLGDSITDNGTYIAFLDTLRLSEPRLAGFEFLNLGVNGENTSGLAEADLPGPRPNIHGRLAAVLEKAKPDWVLACYGMNDGAFGPPSEATTRAFRGGMSRLLERLRGLERVVVLTPPPFQTSRVPRPCHDLGAPPHGYQTPYTGYDDVLRSFADWELLSCPGLGAEVVDLHALLGATGYVADDGVHPGLAGHEMIARLLLTHVFGLEALLAPLSEPMLQRHRLLSAAWKEAIGHENPIKVDALPLEQAQKLADELEARARRELSSPAAPHSTTAAAKPPTAPPPA